MARFVALVLALAQAAAALALPLDARSSSPKLVFAHHIVGNTFTYTQDTWTNDILLAASKGIDAFALNIGPDSWELGQVSSAFAAAESLSANTTFKLFISFDMSVFPCSQASHASTIQQYIQQFAGHPNQLQVSGRPFVSTFSGESCTFGTGSVNQGWTNVVRTSGLNAYFVPSFFVDPATFGSYPVADGVFGWNSGWPTGNFNITFDPDQSYIANLGGRAYMAAASAWFFTHYSPQTFDKNFIYRGDDWLLAQRWEALIAHRDAVDFVEVNTWNDYGESHYVGPIEGVQPASQAWVDGFDHTAWLDLIAHYITAFKTGAPAPITRDRTFLWARLAPANANAPADTVGRPANWQWTSDALWAIIQLTSPATVTLTCGPSALTAPLPAGTSKLRLALVAECDVASSVTRGGQSVAFKPEGMHFSTAPAAYNFNAFVVASP
ncbi:glycoside hydrolase family 71 protein [Phanerochaete sordida]|uniref:Glycoside hydrolase family 71 protein n=1 Tax=Phanerochaete sordida TaxID=48140 RepID=A0A9P3GEM2_9APHY|nr:glycoside hydrolase family 71 protein [Phanerochaete sordida]